MAELSKIFKTNDLYEAWRNNKDIPSNVLAVVLNETGADVEKVAFGTNNIDGRYQTYEVEKSTTQPLQAVGYMFGNYVGMPMYEMGSEEVYPCDFLEITSIDGITTYEGYIYIKYNRAMTDEEAIAEITKITGDAIENVRRVEGEENLIQIIWRAKDEDITSDIIINYDGSTICSFFNAEYTQYCNTGIILMGSTSPITQKNWNTHLEVGNIITNDICTTLYHVGETGEYHILIMAKNYQRINFPIDIFFNHGTEIIEQYPLSPQKTFVNNGLRCYVFDFQGIPTPSQIDTIEISWGNAYYVMKFV